MNFFEGGRRVLMIVIGISVLVSIFVLPNEPILTKVKNLGLWIAFLWGAAWAIGWVVRGILGIPSGQDSKD